MKLLSIAGLDSEEAVQGFVDEFGLAFDHAFDENAELWPRFDVFAQGQWVMIDAAGNATLVPYDLDADQLREQLDTLLAT